MSGNRGGEMFDDVRNGENKSNFNVESGNKYYVKILLRENGFQTVSNSVSPYPPTTYHTYSTHRKYNRKMTHEKFCSH